MIMLVDPPQPPPPSMSWFVQQEDQHRRPIPMTAGIVGEQSKSDWLSLASALVRVAVRVVKRWAAVSFAPMLVTVGWLQERATIHRYSFFVIPLLSLGGGDF